MARTTKITDSISRVGAIPGAVRQGIYEESVTQNAKVGTRMDLGDGRVFYYAKNSSAATNLVAGKLISTPVIATQKCTTLLAEVAVGEKEVQITGAGVGAVTADMYAEGYLYTPTAADTGSGQTYKIRGNEAFATSGTGSIFLYDGVYTVLATTVDVIVTASIFSGVILTPDDVIFTLGVSLIPVNTSYYFWIQTWGPVAVLAGDSTGVATTERCLTPDVAAETDGAHACVAGSAPGAQNIGYHIFDSTDVVDTEYHLVYLTCLP